MVKLQIGLATATRSALIAMLFASLGCVREPTLDVDKWRAAHDTTLTPATRWQLLNELMSQREFVRARLSSTIKLLGTPDYATDDSVVYKIFDRVRSKDSILTTLLVFKFSDDSIITSTTIHKNIDYVRPSP